MRTLCDVCTCMLLSLVGLHWSPPFLFISLDPLIYYQLIASFVATCEAEKTPLFMVTLTAYVQSLMEK